MRKVILVLAMCSVLSACSSNRLEKYKEIKADIAVLCNGATEGVKRVETPFATLIKCIENGSVFTIEKKYYTGPLRILNNFN